MKTIFIILLSVIATSVCAQDGSTANNFSRIADELIATDAEDENGDLESRYENLTLLLANPVDLNKVSEENLRQFYFLTESQIHQFLMYRKSQGTLLSVYELQAIPDFDQHTISYLAPLVKVVDAKTNMNASLVDRIFSKGNSYVITRIETTLEQKQGLSTEDSTQRYLGSAPRVLVRLRSAIPYDYSFGLTLEKDAGEKMSWQPDARKLGGDFSSAHIQLINKGRIRNLILGDYQAQFAQGVILGGAFGLGKGAETITTVRRTNLGFVPHTSAGESGYYRGVALSYQLHENVVVSSFFSNVRRDATLAINETDTTISAFQYSGSHRNLNEVEHERTTSETVAGGIVHYKKKTFEVGLTFQHTRYDHVLQKAESIYNQFTFSGSTNLNAGIFYNYTINNFCLFGEFAQTHTHGNAIVSGILGSLSSNFDMSILLRRFEKNYYSFYANPFSESTQPQNETGIYWGIKYRWSKRLSFGNYVDLFRFPWLGFRRYAPTNGSEWLSRLTFQPSKKISTFIQIRQERKARNLPDETIQYIVEKGVKTNYWASINYAEGILRIRTRIQYSTYSFNKKTSDGIVLLQGVGFDFGKFQITGHYALFQTEDFDNRQYVYENDVYLAFSLPSYDGTGIRSMLMAEYKILKGLSVYIRYAKSAYHNKTEIGTGTEKIIGNTKNDVKFQAVIRF
jgi:hypothetical protein